MHSVKALLQQSSLGFSLRPGFLKFLCIGGSASLLLADLGVHQSELDRLGSQQPERSLLLLQYQVRCSELRRVCDR